VQVRKKTMVQGRWTEYSRRSPMRLRQVRSTDSSDCPGSSSVGRKIAAAATAGIVASARNQTITSAWYRVSSESPVASGLSASTLGARPAIACQARSNSEAR
jgi:hypothetical protein